MPSIPAARDRRVRRPLLLSRAFLSVENNRLSDVLRRLTVISTIFLPVSFLTGFFGMTFQRLARAGDRLFIAIVSMVPLPLFLLGPIRRQAVR